LKRFALESEAKMEGANTQLLPVAIIGGGLAGLQAARLLHEAGIGFRLFEARDRLGGRILSTDAAGRPAEDGFDLGPSWFWPGMHPAMAGALAQLGLAAFPQYDEGDVLVERQPNRPPQRFPGMRQEPRAMRLVGGTGALVRALAGGLPEGSIQLASWVTQIAMEGDRVRLTLAQSDGGSDSVLAAHVIAALPPRLLEASIFFEPAIDPAIRLRWRDTPTWMAPHAKFVAVYHSPFWRTAGLSGMVQSGVGPMGEIHDATTASGAAALFGFLGIHADRRQTAGTALLTRACLDQLVRLFGDEAGRPATTLLMDWTAEVFTATANDRRGGAHPMPQRGPWVTGAWRDCLSLAGSETSATDPGYLAGAMDAASRAAAEVLQRIAVPGRAAQ
jgi:monoamine oxidase